MTRTGEGSQTVLVITSDDDNHAAVAAMVREHYEHVVDVFYEFGNKTERKAIRNQLAHLDYDIIVSWANGLIFRKSEIDKARLGALNIHPAPPEHGGVWGLYCQPVLQRNVRTHHGVTLHEMDERIDHGPIYYVKRWDVAADDTITAVKKRAFAECFVGLRTVLGAMSATGDGTRGLRALDEAWDPANCHHSVEDVARWYAELPPDHVAHGERVVFNHPDSVPYAPFFREL